MGLGIPELVIILFIVLIFFGGSRLAQIGGGLGKGIGNFKKGLRSAEESEAEDSARRSGDSESKD